MNVLVAYRGGLFGYRHGLVAYRSVLVAYRLGLFDYRNAVIDSRGDIIAYRGSLAGYRRPGVDSRDHVIDYRRTRGAYRNDAVDSRAGSTSYKMSVIRCKRDTQEPSILRTGRIIVFVPLNEFPDLAECLVGDGDFLEGGLDVAVEFVLRDLRQRWSAGRGRCEEERDGLSELRWLVARGGEDFAEIAE